VTGVRGLNWSENEVWYQFRRVRDDETPRCTCACHAAVRNKSD
jgi:hypothetical protein